MDSLESALGAVFFLDISNKKMYNINSKRISINAKFKALGRKIEVRVDIAEFISDILFDVIFA